MSDEFVRVHRDLQRMEVAIMLGLSPNQPESWPSLVDDLRAIRDANGDKEFYRCLSESLKAA